MHVLFVSVAVLLLALLSQFLLMINILMVQEVYNLMIVILFSGKSSVAYDTR